MCLFLLIDLKLNLLFLKLGLFILGLQFNYELVFLKLTPSKVFLELYQCTLNATPSYLLLL